MANLEVGRIADPVRVPDTTLNAQPGAMMSDFLTVTLLERREPRTLDLATGEAELRTRGRSSHRAEILRQRWDARLLEGGWRLDPATPAADPPSAGAAIPQPQP